MADNARTGPHKESPSDVPATARQAKNETQDTPYAHAARAYLDAGWSPVPLPYRKKASPPAGTTGHRGVDVTLEMVKSWGRLGARNIGIRAPDTVLGLDVDSYKEAGATTIAEAEKRLGELPSTFRSSAREDGSGIHWFRVPARRRWKTELGPGVEVIQRSHRYGVVWPSVHPEGMTYGWSDDLGLPMGDVPRVDTLPELAEAWVADLDLGSADEIDAKAEVSDVDGWVAALPGGDPCRAVQAALDRALAALKTGSRHDTMTRAQVALVRLGEQGHAGTPAALEALLSAFSKAVAPDGSRGDDDALREWERGLSGAVATVSAKPTAEGGRGCCPNAADDFADLLLTTPVLEHIRQAAHARLVSAPALLAYVLGRVLLDVRPDVYLPPTVGSAASLNLGVAVVGGSGSGKSALLDVSRELLGLTGEDQAACEKQIGSGEGLVQTFLRRDKETKEMRLIDDPRRLVVVDEVDQLGALGQRSGATLGPTIRSALTGGQLGTENADIERRRNVPAKSYRLVLFAGVQPTRSAALLEDSDAGTPQRFVWVRAVDPTIPDAEVEWPGELKWSPPEVTGFLDYPDHVKAVVRSTRLAQQRGEGRELDGHLVLLRLKVGAALALLHGGTSITDEWWALAGRIVDASLALQEDCKTVLAAEGQKRTAGAAIAASRAQDAAEEDRVKRAAQLILKRVREASGGWVTKHQARPGTHALREHMDDAIEILRLAGQVEVGEYESRGQQGTRLRATT